MLLRTQIVLRYIAHCAQLGIAPWNYFQINAPYFNEEEAVYSKLDINWLIPYQWRLPLYIDDGLKTPDHFPVFVKPLWGQNAHGISRADNLAELQLIRQRNAATYETMPYLIQHAAKEQNEFEIFYVRDDEERDKARIFTITQTKNHTKETLQINSIHNRDTYYRDITELFSDEMQQALWEKIRTIGDFGIARIAACADSRETLVAGEFHIIEINLFIPMPINLLDERYSLAYKSKFIDRFSLALAKVTGVIPKTQRKKPIMFSRVISQKKIRSLFQQV